MLGRALTWRLEVGVRDPRVKKGGCIHFRLDANRQSRKKHRRSEESDDDLLVGAADGAGLGTE